MMYGTGSAKTSKLYKSIDFLNTEIYKPGKQHPLIYIKTVSTRDANRIPIRLKVVSGQYILHIFPQQWFYLCKPAITIYIFKCKLSSSYLFLCWVFRKKNHWFISKQYQQETQIEFQ
jgi:hypothetical protein